MATGVDSVQIVLWDHPGRARWAERVQLLAHLIWSGSVFAFRIVPGTALRKVVSLICSRREAA